MQEQVKQNGSQPFNDKADKVFHQPYINRAGGYLNLQGSYAQVLGIVYNSIQHKKQINTYLLFRCEKRSFADAVCMQTFQNTQHHQQSPGATSAGKSAYCQSHGSLFYEK